jgi:hypothetical protein
VEEEDDAILKAVISFREAVAPRWGHRVRKDLHGIEGYDTSCSESIVRDRTCRDWIESRIVYMTQLMANKKDHATTSEKKVPPSILDDRQDRCFSRALDL